VTNSGSYKVNPIRNRLLGGVDTIIPTVKDGNCAIHALFADPNKEDDYLYYPNAKNKRSELGNKILDLLLDGKIVVGVIKTINMNTLVEVKCEKKDIKKLALTILDDKQCLGLEHVDMIARVEEMNVLVKYDNNQALKLFYKPGSEEPDVTIMFDGVNHWDRIDSSEGEVSNPRNYKFNSENNFTDKKVEPCISQRKINEESKNESGVARNFNYYDNNSKSGPDNFIINPKVHGNTLNGSKNEESKNQEGNNGQVSTDKELLPQISYIVDEDEVTEKKEIGRGGFGIVYKGIWRTIDVAVKELFSGVIDKAKEKYFKEEWLIMAKLRHPNIVTFYGYTDGSKYSIIMAYMPGGSLSSMLYEKHRPILPSWGKKIAVDITKGLLFLHKEKILHRDIKSANILLDKDLLDKDLLDKNLTAKISDFGLSIIREQTTSLEKKAETDSHLIGTKGWMAPELLGSNPKYTEKSDIYSLGVVFWEIASRKVPYANLSIKDISQDCPKKFAELIEVCLDKNSEKRPSAEKILQILEGIEFKDPVQSKCFKNYSDLSVDLQKVLTSKLGNPTQEWDTIKDDKDRLALLGSISNDLGTYSSYDFLRIDFKQFLSEKTQLKRHDYPEPHPSTEDFWNMKDDLQSEWLEKFNK